MSDYFLNLARLALGTGASFSPRIQPEFVTNVDMAFEAAPDVPAATREGSGPTSTLAHLTQNEFHRHERLDQHTHLAPTQETIEHLERTVLGEVRTETERQTERVNEMREREIRDVRETFREVLYESRRIQERNHRETLREVERAVALPERILERQRETERLVVEVRERQATTRETEIRENGGAAQSESATIEVHIGRVEIRAIPEAGAPAKTERAKPAGIIDLNEYLRERSRGNS